jgi:hypothetical protein
MIDYDKFWSEKKSLIENKIFDFIKFTNIGKDSSINPDELTLSKIDDQCHIDKLGKDYSLVVFHLKNKNKNNTIQLFVPKYILFLSFSDKEDIDNSIEYFKNIINQELNNDRELLDLIIRCMDYNINKNDKFITYIKMKY